MGSAAAAYEAACAVVGSRLTVGSSGPRGSSFTSVPEDGASEEEEDEEAAAAAGGGGGAICVLVLVVEICVLKYGDVTGIGSGIGAADFPAACLIA